jgi:transposase-like protein
VKETRKHYTGEEKVGILRRHLLEKEPISTLCDELGLQPTVFYSCTVLSESVTAIPRARS